jgi:prevent-host-death family protein
MTLAQAQSQLEQLIEESGTSHEPILITGKRHNAVLLSEEDWKAIQDTLYLLSIPGMRESIVEGMHIPPEECDAELDW